MQVILLYSGGGGCQ